MLIIGHRGAAGLAPENTLAALQAGFASGADILEFDVRLTSDHIPILIHDSRIAGKRVSGHTLAELRAIATVTTLQEVLDGFFGKVLLNIELKQIDGAQFIYDMVSLYVARQEDWDNVLFSSFKPAALQALRSLSPDTNLALLHHINPYLFMRWHKRLKLAAVGFHRLHASTLALAVARELGIFSYVYTVDRPEAALRLQRRGLDGIVTNYPNKIATALQSSN